jgi:Cilia- and flagella-associated protein 298
MPQTLPAHLQQNVVLWARNVSCNTHPCLTTVLLDPTFSGVVTPLVLFAQAIHADIAPDTAVLWVANRKLDNGKTLAAEVGRNDKTRVTVTVQHAKEPAPPRSMVGHNSVHHM